MPSIFMSHAKEDRDFVIKISKDLETYNIETWVDESELLIGDSLIEKISGAISEVDYIGVVLSKDSVQSEWVQNEITMATKKNIYGKEIEILPLLLTDCDIPNEIKDILILIFGMKVDIF